MPSKPQINPLKSLKSILVRYNFVIFVVVTAFLLIFSVTVLTTILNQQTEGQAPAVIDFDQVTINKLNGLEISSNNSTFNNLPAGRTNPFSE
jgi:hypothetical protein